MPGREPEDRPRDAGVVAGRLTAYLAGVQERLRTAELARVEAQARAEEEAKRRILADALAQKAQAHAVEEGRRRRLQVGLAASLLALTTVGGLGTTAYLQQRQARAAQVELALNETTLLRDQALKAPDDLGRWQAAREAVKRVEVALGETATLRARLRLGDLRREVETGTAAAQTRSRVAGGAGRHPQWTSGCQARRDRRGLCRGVPPGRDRPRRPAPGRGRRPAPGPARRGGAPGAGLPR